MTKTEFARIRALQAHGVPMSAISARLTVDRVLAGRGRAARRVIATAGPKGRPRAAAASTPPPARPAAADNAFAAAVAGLLKPEPNPWAELIKGLTTTRP